MECFPGENGMGALGALGGSAEVEAQGGSPRPPRLSEQLDGEGNRSERFPSFMFATCSQKIRLGKLQ